MCHYRTDQCGYCKSEEISIENYPPVGGSAGGFKVYACRACRAYTFDNAVMGPRATEEELVTGWHSNGEDCVTANPFSDRPYWGQKTRAQMRLWLLDGYGSRQQASLSQPAAELQ